MTSWEQVNVAIINACDKKKLGNIELVVIIGVSRNMNFIYLM